MNHSFYDPKTNIRLVLDEVASNKRKQEYLVYKDDTIMYVFIVKHPFGEEAAEYEFTPASSSGLLPEILNSSISGIQVYYRSNPIISVVSHESMEQFLHDTKIAYMIAEFVVECINKHEF